MRKQILIPICVLVALVVVSCSTNSLKQGSRDPASVTVVETNLETGKRYLDEEKDFEKVYQSMDFKVWDPLVGMVKIPMLGKSDSFKRMAITLSWVRTNPIATFNYIRKSRDPNRLLAAIPVESKDKVTHPGGTVNGSKHTALITRYDDVKSAFEATYEENGQTKHVFTVRNYNKKIRGAIGNDFMLSVDDHARYNGTEKQWMRQLMGPNQMGVVRDTVRRLVKQAIKEGTYIEKRADGSVVGRIEMVSRVARLVPARLTQQYFGFSASDDELLKWSRAAQFEMFHNVKDIPAISEDSNRAGAEMQAAARRIVRERREQMRREPGKYQDLLTRLLTEADKRGDKEFNDERVAIQLIGTLVGNVETSEAAIVQSLQVLFNNPTALEGAKQAARDGNMELLSGYVWDALRFDPVNPFVVRYAERTYTVAKGTDHELVIPRGSIVLLATHSAMLDPQMYPNPMTIDPTRHIAPNNQPEYYHLGDPYHRCLGDYVSKVQVPEIIREILLLEDVKPVAGVVDAKTNPLGISDKGKINKVGGAHRNERGFPERFDIEFKSPVSNPPEFQLVDPNFAYEDFLNQYDRDEFRLCLASGVIDLKKPIETARTLGASEANHEAGDFKHALLFCRLPKNFRDCMTSEYAAGPYKGYAKYVADEKHKQAYAKCADTLRSLSSTEDAFYRQIFFGERIDVNKLSRSEADRTRAPKIDKPGPNGQRVAVNNSGWDYEDHLKFYDRFSFRECLMNPKGWSSYPNSKEMLMYARLPIAFRNCMGLPVTKLAKDIAAKAKKEKRNITELEAQTQARREYFPNCMQGHIDDSGRRMGALTADEIMYFRKYILLETN